MANVSESIICAGYGGQGIMILGKVLASSGMKMGFNVTWMPSYGVEVRGGTAHSMVRICSGAIASPITDLADSAIIMNEPSLDKFEKKIKNGGLLILNTSLVKKSSSRKDVKIVRAALSEEAIKLGNVRVANMIAAGVFAGMKGFLTRDVLEEVILEMAGERKELISINMRAVDRGIKFAEENRND